MEPEGVCIIIEACAQNGVSHFQWGDLQLSFRQAAPAQGVQSGWSGLTPMHDMPPAGPVQSPLTPLSPEAVATLSPQDRAVLQEAMRDQLAFDSPSAYEDELIAGAMERERRYGEQDATKDDDEDEED